MRTMVMLASLTVIEHLNKGAFDSMFASKWLGGILISLLLTAAIVADFRDAIESRS